MNRRESVLGGRIVTHEDVARRDPEPVFVAIRTRAEKNGRGAQSTRGRVGEVALNSARLASPGLDRYVSFSFFFGNAWGCGS